jgi:predicted RNA binding protein YcfA (HicA-like mRNA interferase family)
MPKLKVLSGSDVGKILESFGFVVVKQRGSHIKLRRQVGFGPKQILTVPNHKEIDKGTLKGIIQQVSKFVPETKVRKHFYN